MEELEVIVQRMIDAGEPEENIKLVIEEYNKQGKLAGVAETDATVAPELTASENMDSDLGDGSLDLISSKRGGIEQAQKFGFIPNSKMSGSGTFINVDEKDRSLPKQNGKLVFGDQRTFDQKVFDFQKRYDQALNAEGIFAFLSDIPVNERLSYADKMVEKPQLFESVYNKKLDTFEVKPTKGAYDMISSYLPDDFNLYDTSEQFNQALEDGRAQALRNDPVLKSMIKSQTKALASQYKEWEATKRNEWDLTTQEGVDAAIAIVKGITTIPEPGQVYDGKVEKIESFGAFVEFLPGKTGLVHISEISWTRIENLEDVIEVGDPMRVKILEIDQRSGKFRLSRKVLMDKPEGYVEKPRSDRKRDSFSRRDDRRGGGRNDRRRDDRRGGRNDRRGRDDRRR